MSMEEKVGQLLLVHFQGTEANEDARFLIQDVGVGGFILYNWANELQSFEQVESLCKGLQKMSSTPLFVGVDQEGGRITRLRQGFTQYPDNWVLGEAGDPTAANDAAFKIGLELKAAGININFAPVVDIFNNPHNPVIGKRSFGNNANTVIAFAAMAQEGYRKAGIISCLKHFPGHGDASSDSHLSLSVVNKSEAELIKLELAPYAALAGQADLIMTGHLLVPGLDEEKCSTLSKKTLDYLRSTLGFKGVVISDSLAMEGILKCCISVDEAAIQALIAGCDLLLLGGKQLHNESQFELSPRDVLRVRSSIVNAIKTGRIPAERVDKALTRVQKLKTKFLKHADSSI